MLITITVNLSEYEVIEKDLKELVDRRADRQGSEALRLIRTRAQLELPLMEYQKHETSHRGAGAKSEMPLSKDAVRRE